MREHVEGGPGEASLVERLKECALVDQRASSDVYEPRARPHCRKRFAVNQRRVSWFVARGQNYGVSRQKRVVDTVGADNLDIGCGERRSAADVSPDADYPNLEWVEPSGQL